MKQDLPCPCGSGNQYADCCQPFHQGELPDNALKLMRSRYSAYALCLPAYIIQTTHPANPQFSYNTVRWTLKISKFCRETEFTKLEILDFKEKDPFATVTFVANSAYTERSYFEKLKGKWLYRSGRASLGRDLNLISRDPLHLLPIAYYGRPILRSVADPIDRITDDLRKLVEEMVETMDACDGIGLAAPQINFSIKLFVIRRPIETEEGKIELGEVKVFINPELSMPSSETWKASEGCLSIPSIQSEVERPKEITVEYLNLEGIKMKERVFGWEARIIMHENDHINGILFIDHLEKEERTHLEPFLEKLKF